MLLSFIAESVNTRRRQRPAVGDALLVGTVDGWRQRSLTGVVVKILATADQDGIRQTEPLAPVEPPTTIVSISEG